MTSTHISLARTCSLHLDIMTYISFYITQVRHPSHSFGLFTLNKTPSQSSILTQPIWVNSFDFHPIFTQIIAKDFYLISLPQGQTSLILCFNVAQIISWKLPISIFCFKLSIVSIAQARSSNSFNQKECELASYLLYDLILTYCSPLTQFIFIPYWEN